MFPQVLLITPMEKPINDFPEWLTWAVVAGGDPYCEKVVHETDRGMSAVSAQMPSDITFGDMQVLIHPNGSGFILVLVRRETGSMRFRRTMVFLGISGHEPFSLNTNVDSLAGDIDAWEANELSAHDLVLRAVERISRKVKGECGVMLLPPTKQQWWRQPASRAHLTFAVALLFLYLFYLGIVALMRI